MSFDRLPYQHGAEEFDAVPLSLTEPLPLREGHFYTFSEDVRGELVYRSLMDLSACRGIVAWGPIVAEAEAWDSPEEIEPQRASQGSPWALPSLAISKDSETPQVVEWCRLAGLRASVVGAWVWVPDSSDNQRLAGSRDILEKELRARGFYLSKRRQEFFHDCTVPAVKDRKPGGKLERFHGASSLDTYAAGQHDARPGWRQAKDAKRAAAEARKARRA